MFLYIFLGIERLHREADARSINRQKLKRKVEEEELESYPFKPSINRRSEEMLDMSHYKPIHLRVNDIQRAKHASRLAERLSRDASNPNLTFQPKINETSKQVKKKEDNQKKTKAKKNQNFVLGAILFFCCVFQKYGLLTSIFAFIFFLSLFFFLLL